MFRIEGELVIDRPVEAVFDFVADERNEPRYNPHMRSAQKVSEGPIRAGTRFRSQVASMGRTIGMATVLTAYERPRRLDSATRVSFMDTSGSLTFEPAGTGTRMRWSWQVEPRGLLRLASPVMAGVGRRQERATWVGCKRYLERAGSGGP